MCKMNALFGLALMILLVIVTVVVSEVISADYHSSQYWLRRDETNNNQVKHCLSSGLPREANDSCRLLAVVLDAGSTGTRMHVIEFEYDFNEGVAPLRFKKEHYSDTEPGISAFASNPEKAANSVSELLETAKGFVPEAYRKFTPIALKATAGLRLLPEGQANAIMNSVEERVRTSGFLVDADSVSIMSGTNEGAFAWLTINVLVDRLNNLVQHSENADKISRSDGDSEENRTVASFDLGGGSTQIAFLPINPDRVFGDIDKSQFSHVTNVLGKQIDLYTHSYLGNGLMSSRLSIAKSTKKSSGTSLKSNCLPDGFTIQNWDYAGKWNVTGCSEASFISCAQSAIDYVRVSDVKRVPELNEHDLYLIAYFYGVGAHAGLVPFTADNRGGVTVVRAFKDAARRACARSSAQFGKEVWQPWLCFDLSYIYALLRHGYGLNDDKTIFLTQQLRGDSLSWSLGLAYDLLEKHVDKLVVSGPASTNISFTATEPVNSSLLDEFQRYFKEQTNLVFAYLGIIS